MTDYSHLVDGLDEALDRDPASGSCAMRSHDVLILAITGEGVSLYTKTLYGNDGTPMDEWLDRTRAYHLIDARGGCVVLDHAAIRADLADGSKLASLIDRIRAGHDTEWDGSNMVGTLTDDAREADEDLTELFDGQGRRENLANSWIDDSWSTWDVSEWLQSCASEITAEMTDAELTAWAKEMETAAQIDKVRLAGDVLDWATEIRNDKRKELAEEAA
jgi:hypothetical protein